MNRSSVPSIRPATIDDLPAIVDIYNHYVVHTPITFDLTPVTVAERRPWFDQFAETGRHRLLVAIEDNTVVGYAGTHQFRVKAAYDTTVETTIYLAPDATGRGIGHALYTALFDSHRQRRHPHHHRRHHPPQRSLRRPPRTLRLHPRRRHARRRPQVRTVLGRRLVREATRVDHAS